MKSLVTHLSLALAAIGLTLTAVPAAAAEFGTPRHHPASVQPDTWNKHGHRGYRARDYQARYANQYTAAEPVYRDTRVWQGNDGRYYCRKKDGTTGLIIGGAVGALLGREIDGGYDRTLGTILGGAAGALLGKEVAQGGSSCR